MKDEIRYWSPIWQLAVGLAFMIGAVVRYFWHKDATIEQCALIFLAGVIAIEIGWVDILTQKMEQQARRIRALEEVVQP